MSNQSRPNENSKDSMDLQYDRNPALTGQFNQEGIISTDFFWLNSQIREYFAETNGLIRQSQDNFESLIARASESHGSSFASRLARMTGMGRPDPRTNEKAAATRPNGTDQDRETNRHSDRNSDGFSYVSLRQEGEREQEMSNIRKEIETLKNESKLLAQANENLKRDMDLLEQDYNVQRTNLDEQKFISNGLQGQNELLQRKLEQSIVKAKKLNAIITATAKDKEQLDETVAKAFRDLRGAIHSVVHKYYGAAAMDSTHLQNDHHAKKFAGWSMGNTELRRYGLKAVIFESVQERYLRRPCFGLDHLLEDQLTRFDNQLQNMKVNPVERLEWRKRTTSLAMKFGKDRHDHSNFVRELWRFIRPLKNRIEGQDVRAQEKKHTEAALESIARLAVELMLIIGSSSSNFVVKEIPEGTVADETEKSDMNVVHTKDRDHSKPLMVRCTVFGALYKLKDASDDLNDAIVIEKAEVAC